jgi:DNA mismatch endonuclease (patch repair protein)
MADKLNPQQRRKCMQSIRSKNTKPELLVRKFLFAQGLRYRLNVKQLPGSPDIVLKKYRTAIFINGCFWHGHQDCKYFVLPKTNTNFWQTKIQRNRERDLDRRIKLRDIGWHTITLWECQLNPKKLHTPLAGLENTLCQIYLMDRG